MKGADVDKTGDGAPLTCGEALTFSIQFIQERSR